jgi:hypothetical protein
VESDYGSGAVLTLASLSSVKDYLRLQVEEESGVGEFNFDDDLVTDLIGEATEWIEKYTGQIIVPRTVTVFMENQAGGGKLPGPVLSEDVLLFDHEGEGIDAENFKVIGSTFPELETAFNNRISAQYEAGYADYPLWAVNAVKAYVAWAYFNRGDEDAGSPKRAAAICRPHRKVSVWA